MTEATQEFDPHKVLLEHKMFFEANKETFSPPPPKRLLTPNESESKHNHLRASDHKENYLYMQNNNNNNKETFLPRQYKETQKENKELLIMTIEIGDGNKDTLRVFEQDDPYELARSFCENHGLGAQIIEPLAQNIYTNMEKVLEERAQEIDEDNNGPIYIKDNDNETLKDAGFRTGEFKSFNDIASQGYQQPKLSHNYNEISPAKGSRDTNKQQYEINNSSLSYTNRLEEVPNPFSESSAEKKTNRPSSFHMRPSFNGKVRAPENLHDSTRMSDLTTRDDTTKNWMAKPAETSHRRSVVDYPSDIRLNNASYMLDQFQSEEEYLEYLIASQYGGSQKNNESQRNEFTFTPQINKSSKIMLGNKYQNNRMTVYDRLHNHAKMRSQKIQAMKDSSPLNRSIDNTSRKSVKQPRNDASFVSSLYERGMKKKEEINQMREEARKERILFEESKCTFKPHINPISVEIVNCKPKYEPVEESLINFGRARQEKIERAKSVQKIREIEGCTFQPAINPVSAKIAYEKDSMSQELIKDRFTKLFYDHKIRQVQKEYRMNAHLSQDGFTFTPTINSNSEAIVDRTNFEERSKKFSAKINKIEDLRRQKEESELFDPQTGQPLFRPSVGRPPKEEYRKRRQSIGDYLYNQRNEKENLRKSLCEKEQRSIEAKTVRMSKKSQVIMEDIQRNRLRHIFSLLDSDEDGYISSAKIDITSVGTDVLEAFAPLLCEMEELNQTLTLNDFIEAAEKLLRTLPVHERDNIVMGKRCCHNDGKLEASFHPKINRKSAKLAQGVRPYGNFEALYDYYIDEQKMYEERIKQEQERRKQEELRECSFKPMLLAEANIPILSMNNFNHYYVDHSQ